MTRGRLGRVWTVCSATFVLLVCFGVGLRNVTHAQIGGTPQVDPTNPIVEENRLPGTSLGLLPDREDLVRRSFEFASRQEADAATQMSPRVTPDVWTSGKPIEGYAGKASVNVGESIDLHVSSQYPTFDILIFRQGWYNGVGQRFIRQISNIPGTVQPIPEPDPVTGLVEANWPVTYTLQTASNWVSGVYKIWLIEHSNYEDVGSYIIFVLRDDARQSDILFQVALTTYQAYNNWGGKSLYNYNSVNGRAVAVSFDRPYVDAYGAGLYDTGDNHMVRWLEKNGYDVTYATNVDLEASPDLMANREVFLSNFHDEYWSWNMRANVEAARDQGKDLLFFTSNNVYYQIRFEPSSAGIANRVIVCYKNTSDPMSVSDTPWLTTVRWRDEPVSRPENELLGVMFDTAMAFGEHFPWVVANAQHWVYAGTGLHDGDSIERLMGYEYDRVFDNGLTPSDLQILSHSPAPPQYGTHANGTLYKAPSGALVFSAATNYWPYLLDGRSGWPKDSRVERMTINLLNYTLDQFAIVEGGVDLEGRLAAPSPQWIVTLQVSIVPQAGGATVFHDVATTNDSGQFTTSVLPGDYNIRFKGSHTLARVVPVTLAPGSNVLTIPTLLEGDANDDNRIDITDFSILAASFAQAAGQASYDARADFNIDGAVNISDFSLLATHFATAGEELP
ncbi:MAG: hypothetical protein IPK19_36090 [Chloroflexi bacterium]|nr:hypothetical protein [Chloroflexota bacterium]